MNTGDSVTHSQEKIEVDHVSDANSASRGLRSWNGVEFSDRDHVTAQRKIDYILLPALTLFYFLSFLDRGNIGNANVAGLSKDLHLSSNQYSVALTVTFIPYIIIELPSNMLLKRLGPNIVLPVLVILWGIVTLCQGFVHSMGSLVACRFFLGLLEGGLTPGSVLILSIFYRRHQFQKRATIFFAMTSLAGAFSGLMAYGITKHLTMKNGHDGWRYIFWIEGSITSILGLIVLATRAIPRSPAHAWYLTPREQAALLSWVAEDGQQYVDAKDEKVDWLDAISVVWNNPAIGVVIILHIAAGFFVFGLSYFIPPIVAGLGYTAIRAQLMTVPPNAVAFVVAIVCGIAADRFRQRGVFIMFAGVLGIIGYALNFASKVNRIRYAALFLQITAGGVESPTAASWGVNNSSGHLRRAAYLAIGFAGTNVMGIGSVWAFPATSAPYYRGGSITGMLCAVLFLLLPLVNIINLHRINRKRAAITGPLSEKDRLGALDDRDPRFRFTL